MNVISDEPLVDSVLVQWSPPQHPNGIVTSYEVRLQAEVQGQMKSLSYKSSAELLEYNYTELDAFTQYQIQVSTVCIGAQGARLGPPNFKGPRRPKVIKKTLYICGYQYNKIIFVNFDFKIF